MNNSTSQFTSRHAHLDEALEQHQLDALTLNPGPTLTYLTGLHFHLMERPVIALFIPGKPPIIVMPELEIAKLTSLPFKLQAFPYGEDPESWPVVFEQAALASGINGRKVGVEPTRMRLLEYRYLEDAAPKARYLHADECLAQLRMRKDPIEIAAMRKAVDIAQKALVVLSAIAMGVVLATFGAITGAQWPQISLDLFRDLK